MAVLFVWGGGVHSVYFRRLPSLSILGVVWYKTVLNGGHVCFSQDPILDGFSLYLLRAIWYKVCKTPRFGELPFSLSSLGLLCLLSAFSSYYITTILVYLCIFSTGQGRCMANLFRDSKFKKQS